MSFYVQDFVFTELFFLMNCEKNYDGTQNLILRGNELFPKIGKRINDNDIITIVNFLRNHPEVISLELPYNNITDCGMTTLVNFIKERPIIRHLNLLGNNIGPRSIGFLVSLENILPFYGLRLSGNKLGSEGGKKLSQLLYNKTALRYLDISDTDQTMSSLAYIMKALMPSRGGSTSLEYIDLGRPLPQPFHQVHDAHYAEFLSQVLQDNNVLKELHVQQYGFDFRDMEILIEGLKANNTLICLDVNNNNIGDDGVEYLCQYLKTNPRLECLMIGANNFGDLGALALSFSLPFSRIKLLDITNNRITDDGMINIFYTIRKTVAMKGMLLWGNKLSHKSLTVLQRLFNTGLLDPKRTDIKIYCADKELKASWNTYANRYTNRFYCVPEYGCSSIKKLVRVPEPPVFLPPIHYRHHVDNSEIGFPLNEWRGIMIISKFLDPN